MYLHFYKLWFPRITKEVITRFRPRIRSREGYPGVIVSNNEPHFESYSFQDLPSRKGNKSPSLTRVSPTGYRTSVMIHQSSEGVSASHARVGRAGERRYNRVSGSLSGHYRRCFQRCHLRSSCIAACKTCCNLNRRLVAISIFSTRKQCNCYSSG